jgi:Protein of unknown function (DUF3047)
MKTLLTIILLLACTRAEASDTELHLGRFSTGDLNGWKEQTIGMLKPKTAYSLAKDNDRQVLVARSTKSASGRIYTLNQDPKDYQTLKWSWKIDHTLKKGDEKSRNGDDFAARLCVFFPKGFFSKTPAICYVWANKLPKGEHVVSPLASHIINVAADSGEELAGHWTFHQHNIYDDYRRFFGAEPPRIGAVALMTDTDNTGESAVGYYGDITLVRSPKTEEAKPKEQKTPEAPQKEPRTKEQPSKGIKGNGEPAAPSPEPPTPGKTNNDQNHREPDKKEQPIGTKTPAPAAAPQPALFP